MKLRTMLLASAAVMFAGSAMAADLTNPFYLPGQGEFTSDTKVDYRRAEFDHHDFKGDAWRAAEEVAYGVSDNLAVFGVIGNDFDSEGYFNNGHNFDYELGAAYNMKSGNLLSQVKASYYTIDPKDYLGHHTPHRWLKYVNGEVKLGYDMGDGLVPYVSYGFQGQVDYADRAFYQSAFAGVHKYAGDWAIDAGVRYDFNTDGKNANAWYAQAEVDYYPVENLALGVYGDYYIAGNNVDARPYSYAINDLPKFDSDYTVGVRAKVNF